jgi:hypothetical protein
MINKKYFALIAMAIALNGCSSAPTTTQTSDTSAAAATTEVTKRPAATPVAGGFMPDARLTRVINQFETALSDKPMRGDNVFYCGVGARERMLMAIQVNSEKVPSALLFAMDSNNFGVVPPEYVEAGKGAKFKTGEAKEPTAKLTTITGKGIDLSVVSQGGAATPVAVRSWIKDGKSFNFGGQDTLCTSSLSEAKRFLRRFPDPGQTKDTWE